METAGGYAKEASDEYKKKQAEMMKEALKKNDIVICTALIPGKPAPRILNEELVKLMKPGSVIYDFCLLYTSDAADDDRGVDLGGRRIIKKIFFSSRRRHTRSSSVSWARRCV